MRNFIRDQKLIEIMLTLLALLLVAGCSENGKAKEIKLEKPIDSVEKDKTAIQAVIEKNLTDQKRSTVNYGTLQWTVKQVIWMKNNTLLG